MAGVTGDGYGTVGYCKLCSITDVSIQDDLDKRTGKRKENGTYVYPVSKLNKWMEEHGIAPVAKETIRNHRKHVMHPKDRMVSAVAKRTMERGVQPQQVSEDQFLSSLINLGSQKVQNDPDSVTIEQALKAVQIKKTGGKMGNAQAVLVSIFTGGPQEATIVVEGESKTL